MLAGHWMHILRQLMLQNIKYHRSLSSAVTVGSQSVQSRLSFIESHGIGRLKLIVPDVLKFAQLLVRELLAAIQASAFRQELLNLWVVL